MNITSSMNYCITMGMFAGKMIGVSQNYDRFNLIASVANARKISTPINESGKVVGPRQLHGSHWGICCPYATPEGKKAGLLKDLALTCRITVGESAEGLKELLRLDPELIDLIMPSRRHGHSKVFVNSDWWGWTRDGSAMAKRYRALRRKAGLSPLTGISYHPLRNEVRFSTDPGRFCRPLFVVENGQLLYSTKHLSIVQTEGWDAIMDEGIVEFVDKEEEEFLVVQYSPSSLARLRADEQQVVTHCEIHPSLIFSASASVIPFPDRNQAPRNSYAAQMSKQAVGIPGLNYSFLVKGTYNVLDIPQRPLVETKVASLLGFSNLPAGVNVVLAVCSFMGYNQEDSLVFNRASLDRGLFGITRLLTFYAEVKKTEGEEFAVPEKLQVSEGTIVGRTAAGQRRTSSDVTQQKGTKALLFRPCCKITGNAAKLDPQLCHVLARTTIACRLSKGG